MPGSAGMDTTMTGVDPFTGSYFKVPFLLGFYF
jgi:hypothetical protein